MKIQAIKTRVFKENENLLLFIEEYSKPRENDILVVTSKIVALAEGRTANFNTEEDKEKLIRQESEFALKTKWTWLTIKDGMLLASAGVDESNADGKLILLPKDSFVAADQIRKYFCEKYNIKKLAVVITDSRCLPLRAGVIGVALGYAGFSGFREYRGTKDIFGRELEMTHTDIPDSLASAAVLCMGEGNEQQPLAVISEIELSWQEKVDSSELRIDVDDDMFHPLFEHLPGLRL